jgi:hypothetical protein
MERDVTAAYLQRGARSEDLVAGWLTPSHYNYLNRVVRGRQIGDVIFFQGGTAYNDAVAAAFSRILGKEIIVPPHNGVMGAIGMALLARAVGAAHRRADDLPRLRPRRRSTTRRRLRLQGLLQRVRHQGVHHRGQKTYWGDKCSDRYRKPARSAPSRNG